MNDAASPRPAGTPAENAGAARHFAEMARGLFARATVKAILQRIVDSAPEAVDGCAGAGILLVQRGEIVAGAWSNDLVRRIEILEYELGEGPCVDAIWEHPVFESSDLRDHLADWPKFAPRALEAGIESMLGFRLFVIEDTLGALDLYGDRRHAFDETSRAMGTVLAAHAAIALSGAQVHEQDLATIAGLRDALLSRDVIGQAKGILMATRHLDAEAAFELLVRTPQHDNVKLRTVAETVAQTGQLPEPLDA